MTPDGLRRLQLVTRRFHELKGLNQLIVLPLCILAFWSQPLAAMLRYAGAWAAALGLLLTLAPLLILVAVKTRVSFEAYYRRRFGSVAARARERWLDLLPGTALLLSAVWLDMRAIGEQRPSATLIAGALFSLHIVVRDWPWRAHHLVATVVCAAGAWLTAIVPAMRVDDLMELTRVPISILLAAHVLPAWLDHRLLETTLPANPDAGADAAAADRPVPAE